MASQIFAQDVFYAAYDLRERSHALAPDTVETHVPFLAIDDEPGGLENSEVLRHRRLVYSGKLRKIVHAQLTSRQGVENHETRRVSQRFGNPGLKPVAFGRLQSHDLCSYILYGQMSQRPTTSRLERERGKSFGGFAQEYARFRPTYPDALFEHLAGLCDRRELAWDCGTGSGQAAVGLARHFRRVVATDASFFQVASAPSAGRVFYVVCTAERGALREGSVDLVAAAQALHWFDFAEFYAEARRVVTPEGVIAVWGYGLPSVNGAIDELVKSFYRDVVGPYWPARRRFVEDGYRSIPFPFPELEVAPLDLEAEWDLERFMGYLGTWSAVRRYLARNRHNPLDLVSADLRSLWEQAGGGKLRVRWPLWIRAGRASAIHRKRDPRA